MTQQTTVHDLKDPYRFCHRDSCEHDLVQGVLIQELLAIDGPHPSTSGFGVARNPEREREAA